MIKKLTLSFLFVLLILVSISSIFSYLLQVDQKIIIIISFFIIFLIHYICNIQFRIYKKKLVLSMLLLWVLLKICGGFEIKVFDMINFAFLMPIISYLSTYQKIYSKYLLITIVIIYLLNILVTLFEYKNNINLFYHDMNWKYENLIEGQYFRFRSSGIWGHPLYSSMIHGFMMLCILLSRLPKIIKYCLWLVGISTIFCYDARAATFAVLGCSALLILFTNNISLKNAFLAILLLIILFIVLKDIGSSDLGGKFFDVERSKFDDSSSEARLIAFRMFFDLDFFQLLFGIGDDITYAQKYYNVLCAENAFITLVLRHGIILALIIFYLYLSCILYTTRNIKPKIKFILLSYFLAAGLFNQSLSSVSIWIVFPVVYIMFGVGLNKIILNKK